MQDSEYTPGFLVPESCALYAQQPPLPPPFDFSAIIRACTSFIHSKNQTNTACEHYPGSYYATQLGKNSVVYNIISRRQDGLNTSILAESL